MCCPARMERCAGAWPGFSLCINAPVPWLHGWEPLKKCWKQRKKQKTIQGPLGFALTPCVIPEIGHPNFTLAEDEMAFGMGIHGEPGIWNGPVKTADELAGESLDEILNDMPLGAGQEVCVLINGLGATSQEELYILSGSVHKLLKDKGITIYRTFVGEYATSMEMAGASISICRMADEEMKQWMDMPVHTPFYIQV